MRTQAELDKIRTIWFLILIAAGMLATALMDPKVQAWLFGGMK